MIGKPLLTALVVLGLAAALPAAEETPAAGDNVELKLPKVAYDGVELKLELPKPAYEGTPKNAPAGLNVEKPTGKPRPNMLVPKGCVNLALKKKVTASDDKPIVGKLSQITDGDKAGEEGSWVELGPGLQWVQVDLEKSSEIDAIVLWHYHRDPRVFHGVVVQVSDDPDFIEGVKTIYNNDASNAAGLGVGKDKQYYESNEGKLIDAKGVKARYVRCYSKGSTADEQNQYTEIEVWGRPAVK